MKTPAATAKKTLVGFVVVDALKRGQVASAEEQVAPQANVLTPADISNNLKTTTTYAITDPSGTPYMVVDDRARIICYFFTTEAEARRVLKSAQAVKPTTGELNPWTTATVTPMGLDAAVSLQAKGKTASGTYFMITPNQSDLDDALNRTGVTELSDGKVPLFFSDDLRVPKGYGGSDTRPGLSEQVKPLFFNVKDLSNAWKKFNKDDTKELEVTVTELTAVVKEMLVRQEDPELKELVFVPPKAATKQGKAKTTFKLGERILVL